MYKLISRFKFNNKQITQNKSFILFDFVIAVIGALIFNGFIINSHEADFAQKYFMLFNAALLSTYWYARTFMSQRYEKKGMDFRAILIFSIFSLGSIAVSLDLMVFMKNQTEESQIFLSKVSMLIWLTGYLLSRLIIAFEYLFAAIANRKIYAIFQLTIFKSISRFVVVLISLVFLTLFMLNGNRDQLIFIFMPIFLFVELIGNLWSVNEENIKNAPPISIDSIKERYSRINKILISSFFISGSIQFAFYFRDSTDLYMLGRMFMVYAIGIALWWTYSNRVYRFMIKNTAKSHVLIGITNIFLASSLALMGGMVINSHNDINISLIIPTSFFALAVFIFILTVNIYSFTNNKNEIYNKTIKTKFIYESIMIFIFLCIMGTVSLFFSFSMWVMYSVIFVVLLYLSLSARFTIETRIKKESRFYKG